MSLLATQCPWWLAGLLLGLLMVAMQWTASLSLGAMGSFVAVEAYARKPSTAPTWKAFFFVGMVGGGLVYGLVAGDLHPGFSNGGFNALYGSSLAVKALVLVPAGALIAYGARTAGGCTSGHGICGTSHGSASSFVSTMSFMAAAIVVANVISMLRGAGS